MGSPMACICIYLIYIYIYTYICMQYAYIHMQYAYIHICGFKGIGNIMGFSLFSCIFLGIQKKHIAPWSMVLEYLPIVIDGVNLSKYSIH